MFGLPPLHLLYYTFALSRHILLCFYTSEGAGLFLKEGQLLRLRHMIDGVRQALQDTCK